MNAMEKYYINIGRQLGAGGLKVANELSKRLGIPVFDKELLYLAAKESGIAPEFFKNVDEKPQAYLQGSFWGLNFSPVLNNNYSAFTPLDSRELFKIQSDTIKMLADKQSAIFVGRCADYILKDKDYVISMYMYASEEDCLIRLRDTCSDSDEVLIARMQEIDKNRAEYYKYFTGHTWDDARNYDFCLNTGAMGYDKLIKAVKAYIEIKNS